MNCTFIKTLWCHARFPRERNRDRELTREEAVREVFAPADEGRLAVSWTRDSPSDVWHNSVPKHCAAVNQPDPSAFLEFSPDYNQGKFAAASKQCFSDYNLGWQL